jgi:hypothetical protein
MLGLEICVCFVDKVYLFSQVFKGVLRQSDGFGYVFKGVLCQSTSIAVKRLDGAYQGEKCNTPCFQIVSMNANHDFNQVIKH